MRSTRLGLLFLGIYLTFLGGSAYYNLFFPVRVLHHALITLLLAVWLLARWRRGQGLPLTPINAPLYAAVGVWVASAAFSLHPRVAFESLWFPLTHLLFFFVLYDLFQRGRQRMIFEVQFMLAALIVLITGIELASWYFGLGILPGTSVGWVEVIGPGLLLPLEMRRVSLALSISTLLAGYVAPLVTLAAAWALTAQRRYRSALWLLAGLLLVVLVLTFSRGGLLSLMAAIGVVVVFRLMQHPSVTARVSPRFILAGALVVGIIVSAVFILITLSPERRSGDEGRLDMWTSAVAITRDYPVLGVGPGQFGRAFRDYRDATIAQDKLASAHNVYLNTAAETGIVGLAVSLWLGVAFLRGWRRTWLAAAGGRRIRLEAALGALVGLGVHSLVDVFTITPIVLLIALLAAYCLALPRVGFAVLPSAPRWTALVALVIILAYGLAFIPLDIAQSRYQASLTGGGDALEHAEYAAALDPHLRLYQLQVAYLRNTPDAYTAALALEPTWDTGWLNLAGLALEAGDNDVALEHLDRARQINPTTSASLHWARLAEAAGAAPDSAIVDAYSTAIARGVWLPLSDFWTETQLRRAALDRYLERLPVDSQYRVLSVHDPERAAALVPGAPATAAEWWIVGQQAYDRGDLATAESAFTEAINLAPAAADYYASRARALAAANPAAAERDLKIAELLGATNEYPNAIRATIATSPNEVEQWRVLALPPRAIIQDVPAVLYGRVANFDLPAGLRRVGPGRAALQPWYDLAADAEARGDVDRAATIYRAILDYAFDEAEARDRLAELEK